MLHVVLHVVMGTNVYDVLGSAFATTKLIPLPNSRSRLSASIFDPSFLASSLDSLPFALGRF